MGRKKLYDGVLCSCCRSRQAEVKGLCRACYYKSKYTRKNPENSKHGLRGPAQSETTMIVLDLLGKGVSQTDVSKILNISRQRVSSIAKRENQRAG